MSQKISTAQAQPLLFNYNPSIPKSTAGSRGLDKESANFTAALYSKATDSSHHGRKGYYFQLYCSFNNRQFGGLYSLAEAEKIINQFKGRRRQIEAREFGLVAERVIAQSSGRGS